MPKISVIIPTYNRPELLKKAIKSVLSQTYKDLELIVVDDGQERSAEDIFRAFKDKRVTYIKHSISRGGAAARNTGIKAVQGQFIAFLDDDDEWLPEKLEVQMKEFEGTPRDVGFCFSGVKNIYNDREEISKVPEGINNYYELSLRRLKGFLTVTLIIKKYVFEEVGMFDENLPSHQEPDLMIRVARRFKGLGINQPLVRVDMKEGRERIGTKLERRIRGREMVVYKYIEEFRKRPKVLACHYFQLGIWCRDDGQKEKAREYFKKAWQTKFNTRYFLHYLRLSF